MKILIACEESQRVCKAFRVKGHEAYSCDIQECSGGHPEWHIIQDVLQIINGNCDFITADGIKHEIINKWDMIIAFPPCTHLATSGAAWFEKKRMDGSQLEAINFFCKMLNADCEKIVVENPIGIISGNYIKEHFPDIARKYNLPRKPTQIIHPWMFGDNVSKSTCLWIKGVEPLIPTKSERPDIEWVYYVNNKTGRKTRMDQWYANTWKLHGTERAKTRSKTFPGIARAMAEQWG